MMRFFKMGLRCFEKFDFIVLIFYASYGIRSPDKSGCKAIYLLPYFTTPDPNCVDVLIACIEDRD